jgi:hypothetical protein
MRFYNECPAEFFKERVNEKLGAIRNELMDICKLSINDIWFRNS